jgi:hypothetical protein
MIWRVNQKSMEETEYQELLLEKSKEKTTGNKNPV